MSAAERTVLHVLPHPGGGGETYVDLLSAMPGYRFERVYLSLSPSPSPELASGLVRAARKARAHDLVHAHGEAASALCLPVLATRPSVVTLHGLHLARRLSGFSQKAAVLSLRAVLRAADSTICVAESERDALTALVGKAAARRARVVRNGVRIPSLPDAAERSSVRAELGIEPTEPLAIWVGSLDERKDPLTAIRAAERAAVALLVVGDGPLRPDVDRAAGGRARVLGHRTDVGRLLAAADIYVLTSSREGLSLSLLEAMANGLVPIVLELPENLEAVGDAGILVEPKHDALAAALRHLAADTDARTELGSRARQRVARVFDATVMTNRTRTLYDDVLAGTR